MSFLTCYFIVLPLLSSSYFTQICTCIPLPCDAPSDHGPLTAAAANEPGTCQTRGGGGYRYVGSSEINLTTAAYNRLDALDRLCDMIVFTPYVYTQLADHVIVFGLVVITSPATPIATFTPTQPPRINNA
jgi:hypothetical protein